MWLLIRKLKNHPFSLCKPSHSSYTAGSLQRKRQASTQRACFRVGRRELLQKILLFAYAGMSSTGPVLMRLLLLWGTTVREASPRGSCWQRFRSGGWVGWKPGLSAWYHHSLRVLLTVTAANYLLSKTYLAQQACRGAEHQLHNIQPWAEIREPDGFYWRWTCSSSVHTLLTSETRDLKTRDLRHLIEGTNFYQ